ncbi:MAG TPA: TetR family transcriptional regulator [Casimicrobiaceae bacterium]
MVIRQRAIHTQDRRERSEAILDAAERLLLRVRDRSASMAEVADEAGLAKGTVYLYFSGKEELLLALHERNIDAFFRALIALLEGAGPVTIDDVWPIAQRYVIDAPLCLQLASRCFAMFEQNVPAQTAAAFDARMRARLERAGAALERHFRRLEPGDGVALLRDSYALILGLRQLAGGAAAAPGFAQDAERAVRILWEGRLDRDARRVARS